MTTNKAIEDTKTILKALEMAHPELIKMADAREYKFDPQDIPLLAGIIAILGGVVQGALQESLKLVEQE